ncbi:MAG TPA: hypothetical protein VGS22_23295 [Thermoanaerobaculia bacterium]|jgi:hypothetical protein|nr:hypothetical protein [Thermoanaerobaculia bacterium]
MKTRIFLLAVSMLWLVGGVSRAADGATPNLPAVLSQPALSSQPGCGQGADAGTQPSAALDLFGPKSINLTEFCGACSSSPCAGQPIDLPCWVGGEVGWARCIPPGFQTCPGAGSESWQCQCTTEYW